MTTRRFRRLRLSRCGVGHYVGSYPVIARRYVRGPNGVRVPWWITIGEARYRDRPLVGAFIVHDLPRQDRPTYVEMLRSSGMVVGMFSCALSRWRAGKRLGIPRAMLRAFARVRAFTTIRRRCLTRATRSKRPIERRQLSSVQLAI